MSKSKAKTDEVEEETSMSKTLDTKFGKGAVVTASSRKLETVKEWVPTGSITLDLATGGGIPKGGKCTCILGKESASKTTLGLHIIAEDQKKGNLCSFLDAEGTLDLDYAAALGVDLDMLHIVDRESLLKSLGINPKDRLVVSGEEWIEICCKMLSSNLYGTVVLDSVASLIPMAEITSGMQGVQIGRIAAMMSKAYRAINSALSVSNSAFVYLNQYRMNPGGYGNPFIEPAGEAMKYLQALKIEISKSLDKDQGTGDVYGITVKGSITKSKVCVPHKKFEYYVEFGKGIVREKEIFDLGVIEGLIAKSGGWYTYEDVKLQGEDNFIELLKTDKDLCNRVESGVKEALSKTNEQTI